MMLQGLISPQYYLLSGPI
uniref:Uncharacterized protein n=1 Tax=Anguilla anguilla TaxID=7936 RepID=A0A0E9V1Z4_ANGAN